MDIIIIYVNNQSGNYILSLEGLTNCRVVMRNSEVLFGGFVIKSSSKFPVLEHGVRYSVSTFSQAYYNTFSTGNTRAAACLILNNHLEQTHYCSCLFPVRKEKRKSFLLMFFGARSEDQGIGFSTICPLSLSLSTHDYTGKIKNKFTLKARPLMRLFDLERM